MRSRDHPTPRVPGGCAGTSAEEGVRDGLWLYQQGHRHRPRTSPGCGSCASRTILVGSGNLSCPDGHRRVDIRAIGPGGGGPQRAFAPRPGAGRANTCPFVEKGSVSIRWDGAISPCLPLLHTPRSYLDFRPRTSHAFSVGNVNERGLTEAWSDPGYVGLRERLPGLRFRPLHDLQQLRHGRREPRGLLRQPDPACGGCLWAQGFTSVRSRAITVAAPLGITGPAAKVPPPTVDDLTPQA